MLCSNPVNEFNFKEGYTICQSCYAKYNKKIERYIVVSEPKYKPVILDAEYLKKSFEARLSEPVKYFMILEQEGIDLENWQSIGRETTSPFKAPVALNPFVFQNIPPPDPIVDTNEIVKNTKRKIDL